MSNFDITAAKTAFEAIGEEAEKLLEQSLPVDVVDAIERIISIARYYSDVRTTTEQHASRP